jgi:hypothetical protein
VERSPLATVAALGIVAVLLMTGMYLFSMNQLTDTTAAETARAVDDALDRSLAPETKTRVTVALEGKGLDAPRRYIVRYHPAPALAAEPKTLDRLAERVAALVVERLDHVKAPVQVHCVAELPSGADAQRCFARKGAAGGWTLEPVVPVPPLPAPTRKEEDDAR